MHQWVISRAIPRAEARLSWWPGAPSPPAPRGRASWLEPPPAWLIPPTRREPAQAKGCGQKPNGSKFAPRVQFRGQKKEPKVRSNTRSASWAILLWPVLVKRWRPRRTFLVKIPFSPSKSSNILEYRVIDDVRRIVEPIVDIEDIVEAIVDVVEAISSISRIGFCKTSPLCACAAALGGRRSRRMKRRRMWMN